MTCKVCSGDYGRRDDMTHNPNGDPEWTEHEGRCYGCHLQMIYGIFGGMMEPVFVVTGLPLEIPF